MEIVDKKEIEEAQKMIMPNKLCIHCVHKKRQKRKYKSQIYCEMQPSPYSESGFKTIKAHDYACGLYKQKDR